MRWRDRASESLGWSTKFGTLALTVTKNTSVSLGDHFAEFIEEQVARGRFSSASDVVRAGLRLLEEREARLLALQAALVEGERSGEPETVRL
jgi:antitoxin ParD1/3/4